MIKSFLYLAAAASMFFVVSAEADSFEFSVGENRAVISQIDGVLINPEWSGAIAALYQHDRFFIDTENGIGYRMLNNATLHAGLALDYQYGRHERSDERYRGLGNVSGSIAPAVFVEWEPIKNAVDIYANASKATSGSSGWLYKVELTAGLPINSVLNFFVDLVGSAADKNYAQSYYGVSYPQSLSSYYPMYSPRGGFLNFTSSIGMQYQHSKNISVSTQIGRYQYLDSAAHSPLVDHPAMLTGGVFATYSY